MCPNGIFELYRYGRCWDDRVTSRANDTDGLYRICLLFSPASASRTRIKGAKTLVLTWFSKRPSKANEPSQPIHRTLSGTASLKRSLSEICDSNEKNCFSPVSCTEVTYRRGSRPCCQLSAPWRQTRCMWCGTTDLGIPQVSLVLCPRCSRTTSR